MIYDITYIGRQFREMRQKLGYSQRTLAQRAGVTQPQLSDLERGANVRLSTLAAVARALDVELVPVPRAYVPLVRSTIASRSQPIVGTAQTTA